MSKQQQHVLSTKPGNPSTDIAGVRQLLADGKGGVLLSDAARTMAELQDAEGEPLEGQALVKAAEQFAEARGLAVNTISDAKAAKLPELNGATRDRPPAAQVAEEAHEALYGESNQAQPTGAQPSDQTTTPVPSDQA